MRAVIRACVMVVGAMAACILLWTAPARAQTPDAEHIDTALNALREDPQLVGEKTERVLRWKKSQEKKPEPTEGEWVKWFKAFVAWFNEAGRVLMWVLGAVAALLALWAMRHGFGARTSRLGRVQINAPTHVQDLDIRPDSLPQDIGAAAWWAWQRAADWSARRAALSLLYRGALSHLVHGFAVPIQASSTEGECVALARSVLAHQALADSAARAEFVALLVQVWQRAVYGLQPPDEGLMQRLCQEFGPRLQVTRARPQEPAHVA